MFASFDDARDDEEAMWERLVLKILMKDPSETDRWRRSSTSLATHILQNYARAVGDVDHQAFISWLKKYVRIETKNGALVWNKRTSLLEINKTAMTIYRHYSGKNQEPTEEDNESYQIGQKLDEIDRDTEAPSAPSPGLSTTSLPLNVLQGQFRILSDTEWEFPTRSVPRRTEMESLWDSWVETYWEVDHLVSALVALLPVRRGQYILAADFLSALLFFIPIAQAPYDLSFLLPVINQTMERLKHGHWERVYVLSESKLGLGLSSALARKRDFIEVQDSSLMEDASQMDPLESQCNRFSEFRIGEVNREEDWWLFPGWRLLRRKGSAFERALGQDCRAKAERLLSSCRNFKEFKKIKPGLIETLLETCSIQDIQESVTEIDELWQKVFWVFEGEAGQEELENELILNTLLPLFLWQLKKHMEER